MQTGATIYSQSSTLSGPSKLPGNVHVSMTDIIAATLTLHSNYFQYPLLTVSKLPTVCSLLSEESLTSYFAMKTKAIRRDLLPLPSIQQRNSSPCPIQWKLQQVLVLPPGSDSFMSTLDFILLNLGKDFFL